MANHDKLTRFWGSLNSYLDKRSSSRLEPNGPNYTRATRLSFCFLRVKIQSVIGRLAPPHNDAGLAHAQLAVLSRTIPLLFLILTFNALALAATHLRSSPRFLTVMMPALFCLICFYRIRFWLRLDLSNLDRAAVLALMKRVTVNVTVLGAIFTAWSLSLFQYGGDYAKCHVAFYVAITVISCILCLTHLRRAAWLLMGVVIVPYVIFFLHTGNLVLIAMAANLLLVTGSLIIVMLHNYEDFAGRILSQRETERLSDDNLRLANLDSLTCLPNRRRFIAELELALKIAKEADRSFAVLIVDLDRFKSINDTYGHAAGDTMLKGVGERLMTIVSSSLFIARLGGDEFGAILKNAPDEEAIRAFGANVHTLLQPPFHIRAGCSATIRCSIGAAHYPRSGRTSEKLFECADYALYHGKQNHIGETSVFSETLETQIRKSSQIEQALRSTDLETELSIAFQPIMNIKSKTIVAFEALARWTSHSLGPISPADFIPIAEHTHLMNQITELLFAKTLQAIEFLPKQSQVAFNLSAHDLCSRITVAKLHSMIIQSGLDPRRIIFEITESALLQDFDLAEEAIFTLHAIGACIALDDFGAGFSSLGYVHRLKLDKIKIDRSFVANIQVSDTSRKIIRSILDLCRNLELDCIIEGVETEAQLDILRDLGVGLAQGYLFGKPMPAHSILTFQSKSN